MTKQSKTKLTPKSPRRGKLSQDSSSGGLTSGKGSVKALGTRPPLADPQPLTPNEKQVLEFLESFIQKKGFAPSYEEVKTKFGYASFFSVQRYFKQLEEKGYIQTPWQNKKRAITIVHSASSLLSRSPLNKREEAVSHLEIPFLGKVAAGRPIEALSYNETYEVPRHMIKKPHETFALRVQGESMIDDGIRDGDVLVIQKQSTAVNGQTVVALIDNEATVKRFYQHGGEIELKPSNPTMKSFFVPADQVSISGIVVGLLRSFK